MRTRSLLQRAWRPAPLTPRCPLPRPIAAPPPLLPLTSRPASSSSSSTRWKSRATRDPHTRAAKVSGLKSRAAYKLLELDSKHHLFSRGDTVIDLGYAPGSWSQVAVNRTSPGGRVVGIDIIPAQPPRGASSIQGNFLSPDVQAEVREYVLEHGRGRARVRGIGSLEKGVADMAISEEQGEGHSDANKKLSRRELDDTKGRVVDVVLSDMSAPWDLTTGSWVKSVSNPWYRMMNTSGMPFRDHAGSMDLCLAALTFGFDTLRTGGNFLCKFYQGAEDKAFEMKLKRLFERVHREKPESSRSESKEAYFVALRRKPDVERSAVFPEE